jgi:GTP cyclohydrolase I
VVKLVVCNADIQVDDFEMTPQWFVGFFEGEGSFGYVGQRAYPQLTISQKEITVLQRVKKWLNGQEIQCNVHIQDQSGYKDHGQMGFLRITNRENLKPIIDWFSLYLVSEKRRAQFASWFTEFEAYLEGAPKGQGRFGDRVTTAQDFGKVQRGVELLLSGLGLDWQRELHLQRTPERMAEFLTSWITSNQECPDLTTFESTHDEMVIVGDIPFYSLCAHHLLLFYGKAYVTYIPKGKIVGLSKIARVVDWLSRRPQVQETLTVEIADTLEKALEPLGLGVVLEAEHTCISARGVQKPGTRTVTSAVRGALRDRPEAREEFLRLIGR